MLKILNDDFGLGSGYSSDRNMITGTNCLKKLNIIYSNKATSSITYYDDRSGNGISSAFGFDAAYSGMVYPTIIGSLAVNFAESTKNNRYSQNFNFILNNQIANQVLHIKQYGYQNLNDLGISSLESNITDFRNICGDQFISEQTLGTRLFIAMQISFASNYDKTIFGMAMGVSMDWFVMSITLQAKLSAMSENENINLDLTISAYQEGGNALLLANIFNSTSGGVLQAISCGIHNLKPCTDVIQGIVNYAKGEFTEQIGVINGQIYGMPAVISNVYTKYEKIGIDSGKTIVTPEISAVRTEMIAQYETFKDQKIFLEQLLYKSQFSNMTNYNNSTLNKELGYKKFYLSREALETLTIKVANSYWTWSPTQITIEMRLTLAKNLKNLNDNIDILHANQGGIIGCFEQPTNCLTMPTLKIVDKNVIKNFQTAYEMITTCDGIAFGRFIVPIGMNLYEERSKFININNETIIFNNKYLIEQQQVAGVNQITLSTVSAGIYQNIISCAQIAASNDSDVMPVYKGILDEECATNFCPNGLSIENKIVGVVFITIDTPL